MDFITGALPNVMFICGIIAIGIGLGIEFKIVEVKGQLSKQGRFGAIAVGGLLILVSVFLYTRPPQPAPVAGAQPAAAQAVAGAPAAAQQTPPPPTQAPAPTKSAAAQAPAPTQIPAPTAAPTTAPTNVPGVLVPDIRDKSSKDAKKLLEAAGLELGDRVGNCADIGAGEIREVKKGRINCQSLQPGSTAAPGTRVAYVQAD